MSVLTIGNTNFEEEVIKSDKPVLLDFWASWCGPCRMLSPMVDEVAEELAGSVKVGKVNVDDESDLASQYQIMSIPTLVVIKDGKEVKRSVGVISKQEIKDLIR